MGGGQTVSIKNLSENHEFSILNKMVIKGGRCVPGSNIINSPLERVQERRNRVEWAQRRQPPEQDEYGSGKDSGRPRG